MRHGRLPLLAGLLTLLAVPAPAAAGTAHVRASLVHLDDGETFRTRALEYVAAPGERNDVAASIERLPDGSAYGVIRDIAGTTPGPGCERPAPADPDTVRCRLGSADATPHGFTPATEAFRLVLGDGDDRAVIAAQAGVAAVMDGGPGDDVLTGGSGTAPSGHDQSLTGNRLRGGPGDDVLTGGRQNDIFDESGRSPNGSDTIRGGGGFDAVDYAGRLGPVHADLRGDRRAGEAGERDHLLPGLGEVRGGRGADTLIANGGFNRLVGDTLVGGPGADLLVGGAGPDVLVGGSDPRFPRPSLDGPSAADGHDHVGNVIRGGGGGDTILGTAGPDVLSGGAGSNAIEAGAGNDRIDARNGASDFAVDCGAGRDRARLDGQDFPVGCERRLVRGAPRAVVTGGDPLSQDRSALVPIGCPPDHAGACRVRVRIVAQGRLAGLAIRTIRRGAKREVRVPYNAAGRALARRRPDGVLGSVVLRTREPHRRTAVFRAAIRIVE